VSKVKGKVSNLKYKIKDRISKVKDRLKKLNCNNVFDGIAERINNATNRIIENPVNKGRDWLKKNIGGNINCPKSSTKPVKKHLRTKQMPTTDDSRTKGEPLLTNDDSINKPKPVVTNDDSMPRTKTKSKGKPGVTIDDSITKSKPSPVIRKKSKPRPKNAPIIPVKTNDDSIRPIVKTNDDSRPKPRPITIVKTNDDTTPRPVINNNDDTRPKHRANKRKPPLNNDDEIVSVPTKRSRISPSFIPTHRPKTILVDTNIITTNPSTNPSLKPSTKPSPKPNSKPSTKPTPNPSLKPTITYISWAAFSSAPVIVRPSSFPTLVPTTPTFNILTNPPTERPSIKTQNPTLIHLSTISPTVIPTLKPTLISTTHIPTTSHPTSGYPTTIRPTTSYPTTSYPTITTNVVNSVNSNKNDTGNQTNMTSIIIAVVVVFVVMFALIAFLCFGKKKEKHDPYQIWTNFYETKQNRMSEKLPTDIHHFYNKPVTTLSMHGKTLLVPPRLSIHPNLGRL
jgi:hypothetical protein